ncbi:hepatoma-derived growth factor-related protein 3 [Drosophila tropicalis]|uniref:hepatoma-derived growth factor-related protein 3 n=1 Tax=Drosophila tropicalis TaxID=46794 RepID=UPI0035AC2600
MPRKKIHKTPIKVGDFVFAKVNGYRAWPARVLEVNSRYHIYFYGTCNTTKVNRKQIFPYAKPQKSLGNLINRRVGRKSTFRVAMRDVELAFKDPNNDSEYFNLLKVVQGLSFTDGLVYGMLSDSSLSDSAKEEDEHDDDSEPEEEKEDEDDNDSEPEEEEEDEGDDDSEPEKEEVDEDDDDLETEEDQSQTDSDSNM